MAVKTNERPGTRAVLRHSRMSATKAREVLDLIRNRDYVSAAEILEYTERAAGPVVLKLLHSAAANAANNDGLDPSELYVSTCYADEGETLKRWRPRARGRASRIRKRTCHITIILSRMTNEQIARRRARVAADVAGRRARRVAGTRRRDEQVGAPVEPEAETPVLDEELPAVEGGAGAAEPEVVEAFAQDPEAVESEAVEVEAHGSEQVESSNEAESAAGAQGSTEPGSKEEEG